MKKVLLSWLMIIPLFALAEPFEESFVLNNGVKGKFDPITTIFFTTNPYGFKGSVQNDGSVNLEQKTVVLLLGQRLIPQWYDSVKIPIVERDNGWLYIIWIDRDGLHVRMQSPNNVWWQSHNMTSCIPIENVLNLDSIFNKLDNLIIEKEANPFDLDKFLNCFEPWNYREPNFLVGGIKQDNDWEYAIWKTLKNTFIFARSPIPENKWYRVKDQDCFPEISDLDKNRAELNYIILENRISKCLELMK